MFLMYVKTKAGNLVVLEKTSSGYQIRSSTSTYLGNAVLGKHVRNPVEGSPLEIYLNSTDVIYSSIVTDIMEENK